MCYVRFLGSFSYLSGRQGRRLGCMLNRAGIARGDHSGALLRRLPKTTLFTLLGKSASHVCA